MLKFKQFLSEMPLNRWKIFPFVRNEPETGKEKYSLDHFSQIDRSYITSFKVIRTCDQVLQRSKYHFNILFVETTVKTKKEYLQLVEKLCIENNIPIQNSITYTKNSSTGSFLSCWMVLHTIGHALLEDNKILNNIEKLLNEYYQYYKEDSVRLDKDYLSRLKYYQTLVDFKSANEDKVESVEEFIYELVACHLWYGRIKVRRYPELFSEIDILIDSALRNSVGHIIADFY